MTDLPKLRILVVDDNSEIHYDFIKILTKATSAPELDNLQHAIFGKEVKTELVFTLPDFEITTASQGQEGVKIIENALKEGKPYALAFIDIRMPPGWDGIETIRHIWELDPDVQIVICTAYSDYSWEETVEKLGQKDNLLILKKPFDQLAVRQLSYALTRKWQLLQESREYTNLLEQRIDERTAEIQLKNKEVAETLVKLNDVQQHLIQSVKMATVGQLSAGIAHEINNPLSFALSNIGTLHKRISSLLELLDFYKKLCDKIPGKQFEGLTDEINTFIKEKHLTSIISDLDALVTETKGGLFRIKDIVSNLEKFAGTQSADLQPIDINACIESAIQIVWNKIKTKCELHKNLGKIPNVIADPNQVQIVILNLLNNAEQSIVKNGVISVTSSATKSHVLITIEDNGSGISPENISKLFTPFFTTKPIGSGAGLGLATAYGIIKLQGGSISVKTKEGSGSIFTVSLPIKK